MFSDNGLPRVNMIGTFLLFECLTLANQTDNSFFLNVNQHLLARVE
jgi:hypothetical protein